MPIQIFRTSLRIALTATAVALSGLALAAGTANAQFIQRSAPPVAPPQASPGLASPNSPTQSPICQRLEAQLGIIDRGNSGANGARAEQIRRYEEMVSQQQTELARIRAQAQRNGCEGGGFFSIFTSQPAQCGPINSQMQTMRTNLDRIMGDLQQLRVADAGGAQDSQRRSVILALAQNNCGAQYAAMARGIQSGSFLDTLFGGGTILPGGSPGNTFRTVCVRTCDGFYFPISFATAPDRFAEDQNSCKRQCPAAEVELFSYRNPGEDMSQAMSINGQPYTALPNAFKYRQAFNPSCSCRAPGQSWADAMKGLDERSSLSNGDILVTDDRAKKLSQPITRPQSRTQSSAPARSSDTNNNTGAQQGTSAGSNQKIRSVGPIFIPATR